MRPYPFTEAAQDAVLAHIGRKAGLIPEMAPLLNACENSNSNGLGAGWKQLCVSPDTLLHTAPDDTEWLITAEGNGYLGVCGPLAIRESTAAHVTAQIDFRHAETAS
jgi:hypothetical protein